ncbi:MAG: RNA polymerase sigma factor (sigma-70 family), partial [Cognaticolwellia sp.]
MFALLFAMVHRPTDEELVQRFKEGDRKAYSELVRRYQNRVFSVCMRWLKGDRQIAEEVSQDVFLALFRALPGFRGDAQLSTWVYRVA